MRVLGVTVSSGNEVGKESYQNIVDASSVFAQIHQGEDLAPIAPAPIAHRAVFARDAAQVAQVS